MRRLAEGNPGALTALLSVQREATEEEFSKCCGFLDYHQLRGSNIYLIWNDLCNRDNLKFKQYLLESYFNDSSNQNRQRIMFS